MKLEEALDLSEVGNKAYNLGQMMNLGIAVPPGFVITNSEFRQFLEVNHLRERSQNQEVVRNSPIPSPIVDQILHLRKSLPAGLLIIRSSAVGEDGTTASFAGQLDSIADVDTPDDIRRALSTCWASYWNERVLFYERARNVRLKGMGVIVQSQVASRISGVLFTQPPSSGADDQMMVEYCPGSGEALVSGRVDPGRFRISKADHSIVIDQAAELDDESGALLFEPRQISRMARAAQTLEEYFKGPQDIEWTMDQDGELFLLQCRPITVRPVPAVEDHGRPQRWSNANVNENYPGAITPFLYSIARDGYYYYFRNLAIAFGLSNERIESMEYSLRHIVGVHHARLYYNLTAIHAVLRSAPFGETLAEFFTSFVGASRLAPGIESRHLLELPRIAAKTTWQYLFLTRRVETFERVVDEFAARTLPADLDKRSLLELRDDLRGFMGIRCHQWTNAALADAAAMVTYGLLKGLLHSAYPSDDGSALHNNLLKGLGGVESVKPAVELWELSRTILAKPETKEAAIQDYLDRWGFRLSGELMLTVPSLQEQPAPLMDILNAYVHAEGASPIETIGKREAERETETARVLEDLRRNPRIARIPRWLQAPIVDRILKCTQRSITLRERARSKQSLLYNRCRRIALAIGKHLVRSGSLAESSDVFFLTHSELEDFLSGYAMFPTEIPAVVANRIRAQKDASRFTAPDDFMQPAGEYLPAIGLESPATAQASGDEMRGIGACGGKVTARAAVLESVAEAHKLRQGDILVTRQTDPGWAPVFFLIRGLVIERGGMLSHGAIIAREFGLPCVVGVKQATSQIRHGCSISVDGDRGHVQIVD